MAYVGVPLQGIPADATNHRFIDPSEDRGNIDLTQLRKSL
jgi:hypothetical protein